MNLRWKAEPITHRPLADAESEAFATYAPLFLRRMSRLNALRTLPWLSEPERRLVNQALYSTFWDCAGIDARDEAIEVIDDTHHRS